MGYSTSFSGNFTLSRQLTLDELNEFADIEDGGGPGSPDGYCQWVPRKDGKSFGWDGSEKFYFYEEWIKWLCKEFFPPLGIEVGGSVTWQGEESGDRGEIVVARGNVVRVFSVRETPCEHCDGKGFAETLAEKHAP